MLRVDCRKIFAFPSPCGVNIVANHWVSALTKSLLLLVSVPLRGKYRGEYEEYAEEDEEVFESFRPLAG